MGNLSSIAFIAVGAAFGTLILLSLISAIISRILYICMPNEILIFSGRSFTLPDGTKVGFKVLHGGRGVRVPLLETVSRMDMRLMPVELTVQNVYSKGGIPLTVHAIANVKIASDPKLVRNAVERFLGSPPTQIAGVARTTLEGVLRDTLSQLTPEEVNEDRLKFAETLIVHARDDFETLGLELDVLKIQHVSDDQHYLANLGRARVASMIRDAQNAENQANQVIAEAQAAARQRAETAQKQSEALVLQKRNAVREALANLKAQAESIELEANIAAQTARATAEQELQQSRGELATIRLQCETVLPAEAQRQASEAAARGALAPVVQNGAATAQALALVAEQWRAAGGAGREVYVLQQLQTLTQSAIARVQQMQIDEAVVVDGPEGGGYAAIAASFPTAVIEVLHETARAAGIDLSVLLGAKKEG